ncbi:MAG TPA: Entericidin EcnAB [Casimicrobiaceae bacterium]|nr:Entericidin EcnAB [Casimicrobiaceae bacterium]
MTSFHRKLIAAARPLLLLFACTLSLVGCNTISGFGKDVEAVGGGVAAQPSNKH